MPTSKEVLIAAQNEQLQVVAKNRVAVLTGLAELEEFGGVDDYVASLLAIVQNNTDGIVLTKVREVLPNSEILDKAIKTLVDKKEIANEAVGKRRQMLKPMKTDAAPPAPQETVEVDTNPTDDPAWEAVTPAPTKEPTPIMAKNPAGNAQ